MKNWSKKKKTTLIVSIVITLILVGIIIFLAQNKTFFKDKYISVTNKEIFVPRFSYFKEENETSAKFTSLKGTTVLEKEISNYLETFNYYVDVDSAGYKKDSLIIFNYTVADKGWYREILVEYK